jgi:hypothetical protein
MRNDLGFLILILLTGCSRVSDREHAKNQSIGEINHFNIVVALDLSNRLDKALNPRPLSDEKIIKVLMDNIYPTILNHGRSEGQKDRYSIEIINKRLFSAFSVDASALTLDFSKFEKQVERIEYLKNKSAGRTYSADTSRLLEAYRNIVKRCDSNYHGADIWTFLKEDITPNKVSLREDTITYDGNIFKVRFRNILILLTDGYVEAGLYGVKGCSPLDDRQCYYLSQNRIAKFREAYLKSGADNLASFFEESRYGIVPVDNQALRGIEVLILEVNDRSKGVGGNATVHPTDLEIIKLFWTDWLAKSGVKRVELWPTMSRKEDVRDVILDFIGVESKQK